jgi:hypothetical protein
MKMDFEILLDHPFSDLCILTELSHLTNKRVLSIANDFEDGGWRFGRFQSFIWDNIAETSLSYRERSSLIGQSHTLLSEAARSLRLTDKDDEIGKGSELAEIVLYGIMKHHYKALPVVPKIFYKQNPKDNAKGADSVHILVNEDGTDFSLWFGEAKFYKSIEDTRLGAIIESVKASLTTEKLKKENSIITNLSDLNHLIVNEDLRAQIIDALGTGKSIDTLKAKLHIPILLLHECAITKSSSELTEKYKNEIKAYHSDRANSYFKRQFSGLSTIFKYDQIKFHLILFPVPSKSQIVDKFLANVEHYKDQ